jgi:hypothetical protein
VKTAYARLRQRLVLTAEETKAIVFATLMLLLGLAAKHYRAAHPLAVPPAKADNSARQALPARSTR